MTNNNLPYIVKKAPYKITVEQDKIYSIHSSGYNKKQPFSMALTEKKPHHIIPLNIRLQKIRQCILWL